ncbi:hypothetical protein QW131_24750 [Roseibium salinum]|nr:hypothetical protein [Roseibium salinum]
MTFVNRSRAILHAGGGARLCPFGSGFTDRHLHSFRGLKDPHFTACARARQVCRLAALIRAGFRARPDKDPPECRTTAAGKIAQNSLLLKKLSAGNPGDGSQHVELARI